MYNLHFDRRFIYSFIESFKIYFKTKVHIPMCEANQTKCAVQQSTAQRDTNLAFKEFLMIHTH